MLRLGRTAADCDAKSFLFVIELGNFDGAASCGVTELGPAGGVVAVNHLLPGYSHRGRVLSGKGGNRSMGDKVSRDAGWMGLVASARDKGVIGWAGSVRGTTLGEIAADPFFQGGRIYVRTYTHVYCIGR